MNDKLREFIRTRKLSPQNLNGSDNLSGYPCIEISYAEWLTLKTPSSKVLYKINDFPSTYDVLIGNKAVQGDFTPIGKIFKGTSECMRNKGEDLIDVLLRHGWNYITQIFHNENNRDVTAEYPDEVTEEVNPVDLVKYYNHYSDFPIKGNPKALYFEKSNAVLYSWDKVTEQYIPVSELLGRVVIDASEE